MNNLRLDVYQKFREAMLSGTDAWQDLLAENVKLTGPLAQVEGKDAFIAVNAPFFQAIKSSELIKAVAVGDFVITQIVTEVFMPNGQALALSVTEWYEIEDKKIQSLTTYFDTFAFRNALA